jgi:hypothetical protein
VNTKWSAPKTFAEFHARYPEWVAQFVRKQWKTTAYQDSEDLAQQLLAETLRKKVVEKYNPKVISFDTEQGFRNWMNLCWKNIAHDFHSFASKMRKAGDAMLYAKSVEDCKWDGGNGGGDANKDADEIVGTSPEYKRKQESDARSIMAKLEVGEIRKKIAAKRPDLLPAFERWLIGAAAHGDGQDYARLLIRKLALGTKVRPAYRKRGESFDRKTEKQVVKDLKSGMKREAIRRKYACGPSLIARVAEKHGLTRRQQKRKAAAN